MILPVNSVDFTRNLAQVLNCQPFIWILLAHKTRHLNKIFLELQENEVFVGIWKESHKKS